MFECQMVSCSTLADRQQRAHGHRRLNGEWKARQDQQMTPSADDDEQSWAGDRHCQLCQISQRRSSMATMHKHAQLELLTLRHSQPVKVPQQRCYVVVFASVCWQASSRVDRWRPTAHGLIYVVVDLPRQRYNSPPLAWWMRWLRSSVLNVVANDRCYEVDARPRSTNRRAAWRACALTCRCPSTRRGHGPTRATRPRLTE